MNKNPHSGHRSRLKERFLTEGLDSFEPHNILELLLFFGIPQKDTNEIAHALIGEFKTLRGVLDASYDDLLTIKGMSKNAATLLVLLPHVSRKYFDSAQDNTIVVFDSIAKLGHYFTRKYIGYLEEKVSALFLDAKMQELGFQVISTGGLTSAGLDTRKIVEFGLRYKSCSVVLAHNHFNGEVKPSNDDVIATSYLRNALAMIDIDLVDHIIVSQNQYASLCDMGYL